MPAVSYNHQLYYLEDHPEMREAVLRSMPFKKEDKIAGENLADLDIYLESKMARSFIVDGEFPRKPGNRVEFLADEAVRMIRERDGNVKIAILTFNPRNAQRLEKERTKVFDKAKVDLGELISWINS